MLYCSIELATHSHVTGWCLKHPPDPVLAAGVDDSLEAEPDYDDDQEFSYVQFAGGFA
jgi:hypothetical protein